MPDADEVSRQCTDSFPPLFQDLTGHTRDTISVPGTVGRPDKIYKVVENEIPNDLLDCLLLPFTDYELHELYHRIDIFGAEAGHEIPKALWIFGPPAVGKTTISNEAASDIFGRADNAVRVDGAEFREVHKGFQMVALHGLRHDILHADAWKKFKGTGFSNTLKSKIVEQAVENRQHLKVSETAVKEDRVDEMLVNLEAAGYEMHAMCLWAPRCETEARGRPRSIKEGKVFESNVYSVSAQNSLAYGKKWEQKIKSGSPHYKSISYFDNTVFPSRPVHAAEFQLLTNMTHREAEQHAAECKVVQKEHDKLEIAASLARAASTTTESAPSDKGPRMNKRRSVRGEISLQTCAESAPLVSIPMVRSPLISGVASPPLITGVDPSTPLVAAPIASNVQLLPIPLRVDASSAFSDERCLERRRGRAEGFVIGAAIALASVALGSLLRRKGGSTLMF